MKCQRCKEREASVQIVQQISGKKPQTFMLCDVCARELGISIPTFPMTGSFSSNPFAIMGNVFQSNFGLGADDMSVKPADRCSQCKMTFEEFKKTGFLGCPHCYETFSAQMDPVFVRTQMGSKHVGRKLGHKSGKNGGNEASPDKNHPAAETAPDASSRSGTGAGSGKGTEGSGAVKPGRKKKAAARDPAADSAGNGSEELIALERQHLERLIEEKKAAMAKAVTAEDYLLAAKLRDEITELTGKRGEDKE